MAPRSIWRGSISFGLVSVPVRMTTATDSKEVRFHFLHKDDLVPIGYDKVRKDTGEHVDADEIVRGFEIEKGQYVPLDDEDLDRLDIELTTSRSRSSTSSISTRSTRSTFGRPTTCSPKRAPRRRTSCSSALSRRPARSGSRRW
jgi:hypothetical protein